MTFKKFSKRAIVTSAFLGVALASSVALAAWVASGNGNGYAKATTAQSLTTSAVAVTTGLLYPGGTGDVQITINNPNPYPVTVTDVTKTGSIVTSPTNATCDAGTGVTFTNQTGKSIAVPAGGSTTTSFTGAVAMSNASVNACQGQLFVIPVSITGTT
jgi:hypothetical protein